VSAAPALKREVPGLGRELLEEWGREFGDGETGKKIAEEAGEETQKVPASPR
jgi:hypothetical protein